MRSSNGILIYVGNLYLESPVGTVRGGYVDLRRCGGFGVDGSKRGKCSVDGRLLMFELFDDFGKAVWHLILSLCLGYGNHSSSALIERPNAEWTNGGTLYLRAFQR
jgi:hypothetical protein